MVGSPFLLAISIDRDAERRLRQHHPAARPVSARRQDEDRPPPATAIQSAVNRPTWNAGRSAHAPCSSAKAWPPWPASDCSPPTAPPTTAPRTGAAANAASAPSATATAARAPPRRPSLAVQTAATATSDTATSVCENAWMATE